MTDATNDTRDVTLSKALGRLALSLAGWVVISGVAIAVVRVADSPDAARTAVMRLAKMGERFAMFEARIWVGIADGCTAVYENARTVNA